MSDRDALEQALQEADSEAGQTAASMTAAVAKLEQAVQKLTAVAGTTQPPALMESIALLEEAKQSLVEAGQLAASGQQDIQSYLATIDS